MTSNRSVRSVHRWLACAFTVTVIANVVSAVVGGPDWVGYIALAPLVLMMVTGWALLWAHQTGRQRGARQGST